MPEVLAGSAEAAIQTWLVAPGQTLTIGMPLAEVETEKANVEYAAEIDGTVLSLLVAEGVSVKVGDPIAIVGTQGESIEGIVPAGSAPAAAPAAAAPAPVAVPVAAPAPAVAAAPAPAPTPAPAPALATDGDRRFMSPLVRRLARERGLDLAAVAGSGPGGRIVRRDLDGVQPAALTSTSTGSSQPSGAPSSVAEFTDIPLNGMRKAIARRLTESKSTVPHFYLVADCRVDRLIALRAEVNQSAAVKISLNDFVLKAAAAAFIDVPDANATWAETSIRRYSTVDMSVAVAIEGGLVTPVLRSVEKQTLTEIARNVADVAERARAGRLKQHELEGGSFAVSNLGMYGVTEFSAIINPPQSAILAVGLARQQAIVVDGAIEVGTIMTVTMSADHRVLDGALAAQWLAAFVKRIENPVSFLI